MNLRRSLSSLAVVTSFAAIAGSACFWLPGCNSTGVGNPGLTQEEQALVDDGSDSSEAGDTSSSIVSAPLLAITRPAEIVDENTASSTAAYSTGAFFPVGCRTSVKTGTTVTYTFDHCTGPLGLLEISGEVVVKFAARTGGGLDIQFDSVGLTLNGKPVTQTARVGIGFSGTTKTVTSKGTFTGTTKRGYPIVHNTDYAIVSDSTSGCVEIDGSSATDITRPDVVVHLTTVISGYKRCGARNACPQSGTVTFTNAKKLSVTLKYLGGRSVEITSPHGTTTDYKLTCS